MCTAARVGFVTSNRNTSWRVYGVSGVREIAFTYDL